MPLDHYVSQVHLKNFHSPKLGEMIYAIRKPDMKAFRCRTKDVCRIEEGSTNDYLAEPRAIEEFLTTIEPKYNAAVDALRAGKADTDAIYAIVGFVAYVLTCSPAAMRINSGPLRGALEATAAMLDRHGDMSKAPPVLGGKTFSELLDDGTVVLDIDGKYPQAIGISNVMRHVNNLGSCHWEILINEEASSPFFTSDYPIGVEQSAHPRIINRIVPLAPDIAIRICPDFDRKRSGDFTFPSFGSKRHKVAVRKSVTSTA